MSLFLSLGCILTYRINLIKRFLLNFCGVSDVAFIQGQHVLEAVWKESCARQPRVSGFCYHLNLPDGQVKVFGELKLQKNCYQSCSSNYYFQANWNDSWASTCQLYSLLEWQAVKLTFFAYCYGGIYNQSSCFDSSYSKSFVNYKVKQVYEVSLFCCDRIIWNGVH